MATSNKNGQKNSPAARRASRTTRAAKTIDIEANKEKPAAKKPTVAAAKPASKTPDIKPASASGKNGGAKVEPAKTAPAKKSGNFAGSAVSAILGGVITIGGLGVIGQFDGASNLPLIGSLYAERDVEKVDLSNVANLDAVAALKSEIDVLSKQLKTAQTRLKPVDLSNVEGKIAALEKLSATSSVGIDAKTAGRISDLDAASKANGVQLGQLVAQFDDLRAELSAASGQVSMDDETLAKISALESALGEAGKQNASVSKRVGELETRFNPELLANMEDMAKVAENAKVSEKIARSVAVSALQTSIEQNTPYMNALVSIETLSGPTAETTRLKELAASDDVPSLLTLQQQFKSLANQLIPALAADKNAGVFDKLVTSAKSLIKVRSSTPVSGTSAQAIVSRIDGQLASGNLSKVVEEWNGLPEESKSAGADWINNVKLRIEVSRLLNVVLKQASEG